MMMSPTRDRIQHVLVVDDEDDVREVVSTTLRLIAGWRVTEASSGEEALEQVALERPDAVLLDVMMPGMSGTEVAARLQLDERTRSLPVILMTARSGFDAANVISKPFDPTQLPARIRTLLDVADHAEQSDDARAAVSEHLADTWSVKRAGVQARIVRLIAALDWVQWVEGGDAGRQHVREELHGLIGVAGAFGFADAASIGRHAYDIAASDRDLREAEVAHLRALVGDMLAALT